ncbi:Valine--tRNA ligase [Apostasia shenzhenica]|uniref:valine--tRNA ligase n=1 Tax=Apostasia shenzhenica TaxID=1088818 RepID=A0A2H9ZZG2_9ASPA|nr:Valine--tRNA ligase [Apostasia shenzhenica]
MSLAGPYVFSPSSVYSLNPIFATRHSRFLGISSCRWCLKRLNRIFCSAAASKNGPFTSPETAKCFDFTSEERIYKCSASLLSSIPFSHQDIMIRYFRMNGRPTLWLPGTDHAGIATQLVVERMLASEGLKRSEMSREDFTNRVWEWKEKSSPIKGLSCCNYNGYGNLGLYGGTISKQIRRLGASCDWSREHFTLDEQLSRAVIEAFVRLHDKGLIYHGSYLVNWSPSLQTAVSDLALSFSEYNEGKLFLVSDLEENNIKSDFLTIATTRPETLFGDTAVAVHPEDERYTKYIGRQAIVPQTFGRHVPIIADKLVDKEFGTGILKISPGHDHNDYHLARKLGLPILNVMNKDGTLNEVAGLYSGLDRFEARKKLWADLEEIGLAVIEPLVSKQWFLSMDELAEKALHAVEKGELTILPERFNKTYKHWLTNIKDWCISRQLWWGHRIPVWYIVGNDCEDEYIVARNADEALAKAHVKYGKSVEIYQDPDVLDTWFSSSLWPFSTLGWPDVSSEDFTKFYPTTVLETGHDILFFWVARMVMMGIEFTGTLPFSYVYLHGLIRDSQGRKMSKTLGNVIDPIDTIKEYGTDALRFTLSLGTAGQDLNLSSERLASNKAFTNKLWNAGKFILQNLPIENDSTTWEKILAYKFDTEESVNKLPLAECWVVSELHDLIDNVTCSYDKFFFGDAGRDIYDFFWGGFADWYIEASKTRLYHSGSVSDASIAHAVLLYVFKIVLKLLHPFMPFVTEELWQALPFQNKALIVSQWPQTSLPKDGTSIRRFENLQSLIRAIRNARAEYSVEPARHISACIVGNAEVLGYVSVNYAKQSVHLVAGEGLEAFLPLADMIDVSAEAQRLSKRLSKMQSEYNALLTRLNSPNVPYLLLPFLFFFIALTFNLALCQANLQKGRLAICNLIAKWYVSQYLDVICWNWKAKFLFLQIRCIHRSV